MPAWTYILRLRSGLLYVGSTCDLNSRRILHAQGKASRTTRADPPVELAWSEEHATFAEAHARERQIKRWTRAKKEALIRGDMRRLHELAKRASKRRQGAAPA